jgi:hypothetical protein
LKAEEFGTKKTAALTFVEHSGRQRLQLPTEAQLMKTFALAWSTAGN